MSRLADFLAATRRRPPGHARTLGAQRGIIEVAKSPTRHQRAAARVTRLRRRRDRRGAKSPKPLDDLLFATLGLLVGVGVIFLAPRSAPAFGVFAVIGFAGLVGALFFVVRAADTLRSRKRWRWLGPDHGKIVRRRARRAAQVRAWTMTGFGFLCYFLFFSDLWGRITPLKVAFGAALVVGTCYTFRVGQVGPKPRGWTSVRVVVAVLTGALWLHIGTYYGFGMQEADVSRLVFMVHLCWIVSCSVGGAIVATAFTTRVIRKRPKSGSPEVLPDAFD